MLAVIPGDDKPDPLLLEYCTMGHEEQARMHAYLVEGGTRKFASNFLRFCHHLLGEEPEPPAPAPLIRAGLWYPGIGCLFAGGNTHEMAAGKSGGGCLFLSRAGSVGWI